MRPIDIEEILRETPELAWIGEKGFHCLAKEARLELYDPKEVVFQEANAERLMVIVTGALHGMETVNGVERLDRVYYSNQVFGMDDLFSHAEEACTTNNRVLISASTTLLMSIPMDGVRRCLRESEDTRDTFETLEKNYIAYHFIRYSTFLGDLLSAKFLVKFVRAFEEIVYSDGQPVFHQGDDPDGFYLCVAGKLLIEVVVGGKVVYTSEILAGDYFGELALTTDSKRSATISALGESRCYYLAKENFEALVKHAPRLLEGFQLLAKLAY